MKWSLIGRNALATVLSLGMALGATACSRNYVVAFLYVTSTKNTEGLVNAYEVDFRSGSLVQMATSPVSSNGQNPVAIVVAPNGKFFYVVNRNDSSIVQFAIGTDGKPFAQNTYNSVGGTFPVAANITPDGKFLYVLNTYQSGFSTASPGPGSVAIFPINADNSLNRSGASVVAIGRNPVGLVTSTYNNFLYIVEQDTAASNRNLLGFRRDPNTGALTALAGTTIVPGNNPSTGYFSGNTPSAIVEDPTSRYLYVSDRDLNQIVGYTLGSTGVPQVITTSPWATGLFPVAMTIDPRGRYLYVANYSANSVTAFVIDLATGALSGSTGSGSVPVGTGPNCITIENALGKYLFTSNFLDNTASGLQLDPHNGGLTNIQNTPFATSGLPSCAAATANGTHATQIIQP